MKLIDFIKQTYENTLYVSPEFGQTINVRKEHIFQKAEEISKTMYLFGSSFNLKLIDDLFHGLTCLEYPKLMTEIDKSIFEIEEIAPFIKKILELNEEMIKLIISDEDILSLQKIPIEETRSIIEFEVYSFSYKLYEILLLRQSERMINQPYNVFRVLDFFKIYTFFEDYLFSEFHAFKFFLEFQNLELNTISNLILSPCLQIKKIDNLSFYFILNRKQTWVFPSFPGAIKNPVLEISFSTEKNKGYNMQLKAEQRKGVFTYSSEYLDEIIFEVLTALRLSNINYIGFKRIFTLHPGTSAMCREHFVPYLYSFPFERSLKKYVVTEESAQTIVKNYERYERAKTDLKLLAAIRRFNYAYERKFDEDKIIDYFISLETILEISEKSKQAQLAKSISELLENDIKERRKVRSKIVKYYKLRNDIIHNNHETDKTLVLEACEYLESTLRKIINLKLNS